MSSPKPRAGSFVLFLLLIAFTAISAGLAYRGWSFYRLSMLDRVEHPDFRTLRPSGVLGNGYGWIAAMLIILNLSYLVRRRFGGTSFGSMRIWLDIHVCTGLIASSLVSFHSAFQLRTPVATISTASLGLVVLTGLLGRFLYALAPAGVREALRDALAETERAHPGTRDALADGISALPGPEVAANASLLRSALSIPRWRQASRARRAFIQRALPPWRTLSRAQRDAARGLIKAAAAEARASGVTALLRSWRGLHRFFALLMLAAVLLHAGVAWYYGYRWIFT
ncbi:MAG: hypothetical protein R3B48_18120 [Kofleriaceae bacterium]